MRKTKIRSNYLGEPIINLLDKTFVIPDDYVYNIFEVTQEYIARPDLISLDAYGDSLYSDVICKINGISNPFEINEGMLLIIPSPESIMNFIIDAPSKEIENNLEGSGSNSPKLKQKDVNKNSRKTNEAVVGNSRFHINTNTGVIIY